MGRCVSARVGGNSFKGFISRILVPARGIVRIHGNGHVIGRHGRLPNCILIRTTVIKRVPMLLHGAPGILKFLNRSGLGPAPLHRTRIGHLLNTISRVRSIPRRIIVPCIIKRAIGISRKPFDNFSTIVRRIGGRGGGLGIVIGVFNHGAPLRLNFVRIRGRWYVIAYIILSCRVRWVVGG